MEQNEQTNDFTNDIVFDTRFRGYDRAQVDHYLDKITEDYNAICKQCAALEVENKGLRQALSAIRFHRQNREGNSGRPPRSAEGGLLRKGV